jgi:hypothetical protein
MPIGIPNRDRSSVPQDRTYGELLGVLHSVPSRVDLNFKRFLLRPHEL